MSCTCFRLRLRTGLDDWATITSASQATGVKVRFAFCALLSLARALPARSAVPLATASMPEAVLNGCSSIRPWPLLVQACATSLITALAVASSQRQTRLPPAGWELAGAAVEKQAPIRATESKRARRTDMMMRDPGVMETQEMARADDPANAGRRNPYRVFHRPGPQTSSFFMHLRDA